MLNQFTKLFRPEIFLNITNVNSLVVVEENNKSETGLREVTISGIPDGSVAFSLDHKPSKELLKKFGKVGCDRLSWLFNDNHSQVNKKCDFVIISPITGKTQNRCRILMGELKSKTIKERDYQVQLINSQLYMTYVLSLMKTYHSLHISPEFKYVILSNREKKYRLVNKFHTSPSVPNYEMDEKLKFPNRKVENNRIRYSDIV